MRDDLRTIGLGGLDELVRQTLSVSGAIIDHRDLPCGQILRGIFAEHAALLRIVRHHSESALETLGSVGDRRGGRRDLHDAVIAVYLCCRNAGSGIHVADHAAHLVIHQLLRDDGRGLRIGLVVFTDQLEMNLASAYSYSFGIGIVYRHACAIFIVLAQVCLRPGQWRRCTDPDYQFAGGVLAVCGRLFASKQQEC